MTTVATGRAATKARAIGILLLAGAATAALGCVGSRAAAEPTAPVASAAPSLRICADPDNLPFTDERGAGFENQVVQLVAAELGLRPEYVWVPRRPGWLAETLGAGVCDVVPGVPTLARHALTTEPYYSSTYFFVRRADTPRATTAPAEPRSRRLRVGVQMVSDDWADTPPAHAATRSGTIDERQGWFLHADDREGPPGRLMGSLVRGEIDLAIAWGPVAGWFALRQPERFELLALEPGTSLPSTPLVLDIALAVRHDAPELRDRLDAALARVRPQVDHLLSVYGVPRLDSPLFATIPGEEP